jgi:hypothetical protein
MLFTAKEDIELELLIVYLNLWAMMLNVTQMAVMVISKSLESKP